MKQGVVETSEEQGVVEAPEGLGPQTGLDQPSLSMVKKQVRQLLVRRGLRTSLEAPLQ